MSEIHPRAWAGEDAPPDAQGDIDAAEERGRLAAAAANENAMAAVYRKVDAQAAEIAELRSYAKKTQDDCAASAVEVIALRARVEALTAALREARVYVAAYKPFEEHELLARIDAAIAGKE